MALEEAVGVAVRVLLAVNSTNSSHANETHSEVHDAPHDVAHDSAHSSEHGLEEPDKLVLFISFCLFLAVLLGSMMTFVYPYMPKNLRPPFSVLLFSMGFLMGSVSDQIGDLGLATKLVEGVHAHVILLVFLPPLLYESSSNISFHVFQRVLASSLLLAVFGVLVATIITGCLVQLTFTHWGHYNDFGWGWWESMLLGAVLSATDPVAVVASLSELGAPAKLSTLIEGESLLNDGTAFVFFLILLDLVKGVELTVADGVGTFLQLALGGPAWGMATFLLTYLWLRTIHNRNAIVLEIVIVLVSVFVTFFVAELYLHVSSVLATVTFGLLMSFRGQYIMSHGAHEKNHVVWENIAYIANAAIFVIAGVLVQSNISSESTGESWWFLFLIYVYIHIVRALVVFMSFPVLSRIGYGLDWKEAVILWWGGLRGAVGLALGILITRDVEDPKIGNILNFHISGIVFLTLWINGTATEPIYKALKMYLPPPERIGLLKTAFEEMEKETTRVMTKMNKNFFYSKANWARIKRMIPNFADIHTDMGRLTYKGPSIRTVLGEPNFWEQWIAAFGGFPLSEQRKIAEALFKQFDTDGDLTLNHEELAQFMKSPALELGVKTKHVRQFLSQLDSNESGTVSMSEFVDGICAFHEIISGEKLNFVEEAEGERLVMNYTATAPSKKPTKEQRRNLKIVQYEAYLNAVQNQYDHLHHEAELGGAAYVLLSESVAASQDMLSSKSFAKQRLVETQSASAEDEYYIAVYRDRGTNPCAKEWQKFIELLEFSPVIMWCKDIPILRVVVDYYTFFKLRSLVEALTVYVKVHTAVSEMENMADAEDEHGDRLTTLITEHIRMARTRLEKLEEAFPAMFPLVVTLEAAQLVLQAKLHVVEGAFVHGQINKGDRDQLVDIVQRQLRNVVDFHPHSWLSKGDSKKVHDWASNIRMLHGSSASLRLDFDSSANIVLSKKDKQNQNLSLLLHATHMNHARTVESILDEGMPVDSQDYDGRSALHIAASENKMRVAKILLDDYNANPNVLDRWGNSPLDDAYRHDHRAMQKLLEKRGGQQCTSTNEAVREIGEFLYACKEGDDATVKQLIVKKHITVCSKDYDSRTGLHLAAAEGREKVVRYLIIKGADVNEQDRHGRTPLDEARTGQHFRVAALLAENGGTAKDEQDVQTESVGSLLNACARGNVEKVVELLQLARVDPNSHDYDKRYPLHLAAAEGHQTLCKYLLHNGARINAMDRNSSTPLDEAILHDHPQVVAYLRRKGALTGDLVDGSEDVVSFSDSLDSGDFESTYEDAGDDDNESDVDGDDESS